MALEDELVQQAAASVRARYPRWKYREMNPYEPTSFWALIAAELAYELAAERRKARGP